MHYGRSAQGTFCFLTDASEAGKHTENQSGSTLKLSADLFGILSAILRDAEKLEFHFLALPDGKNGQIFL